MFLTQLSDTEVLTCTITLVGERRRVTAELVAHLAEIGKRRLHLRASFNSLYEFCIVKLGLSEGAAYRLVNGAKLAQQFPVLIAHLRDGSLHLSGLELLRKHLTMENHAELFAAAARKTKAEIETMLRARFPLPDVPDRVAPMGFAPTPGVNTQSNDARPPQPPGPSPARLRPLSPERHAVQFTASSELREKIERAQDLMSHVQCGRDLATVFERAIDLLLAELERKQHGKTTGPRPSRGVRHGNIARATKRAVHARDGERCTFVAPDGRRCTATAFLQFEHRVPRARGGSGAADNITVLCAAHNRLSAEDAYGREVVERAISARLKTGRRGDQHRSRATATHLRQRRYAAEPSRDAQDKLTHALLGLGFRKSETASALERLAGESSLADTPLEHLLRRALAILVP